MRHLLALGRNKAKTQPSCFIAPLRAFKYSLLHNHQQTSPSDPNGFTLIELLITVTIILLSAIIVPKLLVARNAVQMSATIKRGVDYAKICALINSSTLGNRPVIAPVDPLRGGVTITEGCLSNSGDIGATLEVSWGSARAERVPCLNTLSSLNSSKALITVNTKSEITCTFMS